MNGFPEVVVLVVLVELSLAPAFTPLLILMFFIGPTSTQIAHL